MKQLITIKAPDSKGVGKEMTIVILDGKVHLDEWHETPVSDEQPHIEGWGEVSFVGGWPADQEAPYITQTGGTTPPAPRRKAKGKAAK